MKYNLYGGGWMNFIEKRIQELEEYDPDLTGRSDLELFWEETLKEYRDIPFEENIRPMPADSKLMQSEVYEISYIGFAETRVYGWFIVPSGSKEEKMPCVVSFPGYQGFASFPEQFSAWTQAGFAVLMLDVRGQMGRTGNHLASDSGQAKGFISQNILDKDRCYYRAFLIDALRGIDWVSNRQEIDSERIAVSGSSQGGGLALAMGALHEKVCAIVANIPNLCHLDYGIYHSTGSLSELAHYLNHYPQHLSQVLDTLSYFDMLNLAHRIQIPAMLSVGLKDPVCPPETIFPVFRRISSQIKELEIYPFLGHTVMPAQQRLGLQFICKHTQSEEI